jgi:uncharacterized protein (UPF0332 family)
MPSVTMVERLLDLADQLVQHGSTSAAFRRRAVSTSYYAVFHALAKLCASILLPSVDRKSEAYERVYRALDHGPIRTAFTTKGSALKGRETLQKIGELIVQLQSERHRADYSPPNNSIFSAEVAKNLVEQARRAVKEIENLSDDDRVALATALLFKSR